ncbi:ABC transporter permease [Ochrobactrum pecoris]|uniref:ABC transporter permease n=1 Tax=Brucella pecoris TaxID=867683 RepID=A0A5C5CE61_9HYPH|nr:ABC transporter permease [Brucella pecoris]MBB4095613.1 ribose transport system permease protein [Brucella pecoris]NKW81855.1 ABC transporter permease [Brucella pecoris]TNV09673.1 ABC transporter permease [Brucella pecoris]
MAISETSDRKKQVSSRSLRHIPLTQEAIVVLVSVVLFGIFAVTLDGFLTSGNILNFIRNVAILGMLSLGMAVVVIGRGVDLSLVAVMAVSLTLSIVMANQGYSFPFALAMGLLFVIAIAVIMGFLIAYVEMPAIFATLAISAIVYGMGRGFIAKLDVNNLPDNLDWFIFLGRGNFLGIPMPIWIFGVAALLLGLFLRKTGLGRFIYAIGDNISTARITGIPVRPMIILQYVISAIMAFLAGCVTAASIASMNMRMVNSTLIYDVLLVVILGGIGLTGGRGGIRNVLVGTILIGLLLNGMTILDISFTVQNLVKSTVLLCALIVDAVINPRDEQTSQQGDI